MDKLELPRISVIMPIRDEAEHIGSCLRAVLGQNYPSELVQVLVADGMSEDGTRHIVRRVASEAGAHDLTIVDNERKTVPTGFNQALERVTGDVVIRVDGHCVISSDYFLRCVEILKATKADCVGGTLKTVGTTRISKVIAMAQSSLFGIGGAWFRLGKMQARFVDTVAFGAYRREVFDQLGGYDEELVRNQDDEFNFRLVQAGGSIWLDPSINVTYFSRASFAKLWRQYFQYGLYKIRVLQKRGRFASYRHVVPAVFVLSVALSMILAVSTERWVWAASVAGPYLLANLAASIMTARRDWEALLFLPVAFFSLHTAYGIGFLWGLWKWRKRWGERADWRANIASARR